ncbi:MAG: hypothetical protein ACRC2T_08565 [Thermoguttaceae bacterium]
MSRKKAFYLIGIAIGLCFSSYCCASDNNAAEYQYSESDVDLIKTLFEKQDYEAIIRTVPEVDEWTDELLSKEYFKGIMQFKECAYIMVNEYDSALNILDKTIEFYEKSGNSEYVFGLTKMQGILRCFCDDYGLAIKSMQKLLEMEHGVISDYQIHQQLAFLYAYTKKYDKAQEELKILESMYPELIVEVLKNVEGSTVDNIIPFRIAESRLIECLEQPDKKMIHRLHLPQETPSSSKQKGFVFNAGILWEVIDVDELKISVENE